MSAIDPKILSKIKKCLALSGSPNPHEAAVALKQAQSLMQKHGVEAHHIGMADVGKSSTNSRTMSRDKPASWEAELAGIVGHAFGCKMLVGRETYPKEFRTYLNKGEFIFIGQKAQAEIAAYTVEVLSRKCKTARQKWITEISEAARTTAVKKSKITRMGDAFAEGWVDSIRGLVADFANPPEVEKAIELVVKEMRTPNEIPLRKLNNHQLKLVGSNYGLEVLIRVASTTRLWWLHLETIIRIWLKVVL